MRVNAQVQCEAGRYFLLIPRVSRHSGWSGGRIRGIRRALIPQHPDSGIDRQRIPGSGKPTIADIPIVAVERVFDIERKAPARFFTGAVNLVPDRRVQSRVPREKVTVHQVALLQSRRVEAAANAKAIERSSFREVVELSRYFRGDVGLQEERCRRENRCHLQPALG